MKRILSILVVIAMLFSMSISSFAAAYPEQENALILNSEFDITSSSTPFALNGASGKEVVKGVFGKDADDESVLITEGANQAYFYVSHDHGEPIYMDNGAPLNGYLVVDFNFKLASNDIKFVQLAVSNRQHNLSEQIDTNDEGYNFFGWNNVRVVYDPTGCEDLSVYNGIAKGQEGAAPIGTKYGKVTTYLNGVDLGTKELKSTEEGWFNNGFNLILVQAYSGNKTAAHNTYLDDIKIYKSDFNEAPTIPYINDGDTYTVADGNITLSDDTTIQDISNNTDDCSGISAYTNDSLAAKITGTKLSSGNVLVVKGSDGETYGYYSVSHADDKNYLVNCKNGEIDGLTRQKYTVSTATGIGGKSAADVSTKLTSFTKTEMAAYDGNGYFSYNYKKTSDYFVVEYNYYPTDDKSRQIFIVTNGNAAVTGNATLEANKWHKVMGYVDFTGESALGYLYVDGKLVSNPEGNVTGFGDGMQIRFGSYGSDDAYHISYIDDIKLYETDTLPVDTTAPALLASGEGITVSGNTVTVKSGTAPTQLVAENPANVVRVYTNNSCTALSSKLFEGAVAVVENIENGALNYYTVSIEKDSSIVTQVTSFNEFIKTPVRAVKTEILGVAGKAADDSSIKIEQNKKADNTTYTSYIDYSWGTSTSLESWDKSDFVGYLVYEFNVYNKSFESIFLGTDQNNPVSSGILASNLESERWNKVSIVLDYSGGENTGKSFVYVNGEKIDEGRSTSALGSAYNTLRLKNTLRLMFNGCAVEKDESGNIINVPADTGTLYIDDINIYETTIAPELATPALDSKYLDENGRFIVDGVIKAGEIESEDTVRVYTNGDFVQLISEDAVIAEGNIIVVEDERGYISYHTAEVWDGTTVISDRLPASFLRGSVEQVSGFAGKHTNNTVYKVTRTSAEDSNVFSGEKWSGTKLNENSKYIVFEVNVMPDEVSNQSMHFASNTHQSIGRRIYIHENNFFADRWNKIVTVYDMETGLTDTYLNGVMIEDDYDTHFGDEGFDAIRLVLYMNVDEYMYVDDYKVYEAVEYPDVDLAPERVNAITEDYITTNDLVYTTADTTIADIKALYTLDSDESIEVFTDLDAATAMTDSERVLDGAVVLITAPGENYYYNIVKIADSIPAAEEGKITVLGDASGEFSVVTKATDGDILVVKQKNNLGKVVATKFLDRVEGDTVISFHPNFVHGEISIFSIDSYETMKPNGKVTALECTLGEAAEEEVQ